MRSTTSSHATPCSLDASEGYAAFLLSAYRSGDVASPDLFLKTAAAVMSNYPEAVLQEAFSPISGLQTRLKWLPTVSEIKEACEQSHGVMLNRERRAYLNEHRVLIDTPRGEMSEPDAERLRLAGPAQRATEHLRLTGPGQDDQRTFGQEEWVERCLRTLFDRMAAPDRAANYSRGPGTTRARVDIENTLRWNLGLAPNTFRIVYEFLLDNPEVYHQAVEIRRSTMGATDAAWRHIARAVNEAGLPITLPVRPLKPDEERRSASPEERARVEEHWEELRPAFKRPARQKPNEPPVNATEGERRAWYERRAESLKDFSDVKIRSKEMLDKLAAMRGEQQPMAEAAE